MASAKIIDMSNRNGLVVLAASLFSIACDKPIVDTAWWQGEEDKITLSQKLELLQYRYEQGKSDTFELLARSFDDLEKLSLKKADLMQQRQALINQIQNLEVDLTQVNDGSLIDKRTSAKGQKYDQFIADGRIYEDVTISAVNGLGVAIRHSQGAATLRFNDLSPEQRDQFGLDLESSLAAENYEREAAVAYHEWIDQSMRVLAEKEKLDAEQAAREAQKSARLRASKLAQGRARASEKSAAQTATSASNSSASSSRSHGNFYRRPSVYYYTPYYRPQTFHPAPDIHGACKWNIKRNAPIPKDAHPINSPESNSIKP